MNLRVRLVLTTLAVAIPIAVGATWVRGDTDLPIAERGGVPAARMRQGPPLRGPRRFIPIGVVLSVVLLALGPVVARIQRLTKGMRRSARSGYASPVEVEGSDEVAELAQAFNDAASEVREQIARQEQRELTLRNFLENTTHDIAIPLTVLQGHLAAIQRHVRDGEPVAEELVAAAMDEAHYMASMTHNLTAAARLESAEARVERAPVELGGVVARAVARHRPIATQHGIELESGAPPEPLQVIGDVTLIEQALSNAVHNAIRYNRAGGHVAVLLEGDGPGRFKLRVLDDGPGMSEDEMGRLAQRRARGELARSRHLDGGGLGLDIARRVAEVHGWSMRLERSEFGGLEVLFEGATR